MSRDLLPARAFDVAAAAALAVLAALLAIAAGQPLFTDDAWWHLALGEAYLARGPWLPEDPLLVAAPGAPAPAAWLADVALYSLWRTGGFTALRVAHVAGVAAILALALALFRRASGSLAVACLGTACFAALAAYRLVQLRPELVTIGATLALYRLLVESGAPASGRRIAASALLFAVWANCHAGFALGLLLLAAALAGLLLALPLRAPAQRAGDVARASRLSLALAAGASAALLNPLGVGVYRAAFGGGGAAELVRVADEWARFDPFRLPVAHLPPSPLAFGLAWVLLVATPLAALAAARRWRAGASADPDPARVGFAAASLLAPLGAVRWLWLGIFPLLLLARELAGRGRRAAALAALLTLPAFVRCGDWPMISGALPRTLADYAAPYAAPKYYAHAVWFVVDAGLEGNAFVDYHIGGYLGFFGAPSLRTLVNGSLNVSHDTLEANRAIRERRGAQPGEDLPALLDRLGIDVFVGTRLPQAGSSQRPWFYTTAHLEGAQGWLCVFRNLDSAVYLRANERNRANLERVAAWYASQRVPFDAERGCETARAIREARAWSIAHGVVPAHFEALNEALRARDRETRAAAREELATLYALLGLYERAEKLDRATLRADRGAPLARRRLVWTLLRQGRSEEALEEAEVQGLADAPLRALADAARRAAVADPDAARSLVARLPLLTPQEADLAMAGVALPEARERRVRPRGRRALMARRSRARAAG